MQLIQSWFKFMTNFKKDFELRRIVFGLSAIIKTREDKLPKFIHEHLPDIMNKLTNLTQRLYILRLDALQGGEDEAEHENLPNDDDSSDYSEEDYQYNCGDGSMYRSRISDIDEI